MVDPTGVVRGAFPGGVVPDPTKLGYIGNGLSAQDNLRLQGGKLGFRFTVPISGFSLGQWRIEAIWTGYSGEISSSENILAASVATVQVQLVQQTFTVGYSLGLALLTIGGPTVFTYKLGVAAKIRMKDLWHQVRADMVFLIVLALTVAFIFWVFIQPFI